MLRENGDSEVSNCDFPDLSNYRSNFLLLSQKKWRHLPWSFRTNFRSTRCSSKEMGFYCICRLIPENCKLHKLLPSFRSKPLLRQGVDQIINSIGSYIENKWKWSKYDWEVISWEQRSNKENKQPNSRAWITSRTLSARVRCHYLKMNDTRGSNAEQGIKTTQNKTTKSGSLTLYSH